MVAGDTPLSDGYMLFNATDIEKGGMRIWVDRKARYTQQVRDWQTSAANRQGELGQPVTADKNWIIVKPDEIH
ncbi:hypothetical protein D9M68_969600 [compost metagenome]